MVIAVIFASAALFVVQPVSDPAPPPPAAPAKANAFADDDKVVCQTTEVTGTLFTKKICRTKAEWAQIKRDSQDLTHDITGGSRQGASPLAGH